MAKLNYLTLYQSCLANAGELVEESQILFERAKYARAYALAFTALEEISKSQLAADVYTGFIEEQEFNDACRDHRKKITRMEWATEDAKRYLAMPEEDYFDVREPTFQNRMSAMYVDFANGTITTPGQLIDAQQARHIIHTVEVALQRILEITEYYGNRIGTKGFMA
ncbi:MAG TPA: AbiV family abortive infection protein [Candidatus Limnocylindrales bacterium]|nr:AbiV family abortive infection protein [Candidatus Limnocylindrales bacterium]